MVLCTRAVSQGLFSEGEVRGRSALGLGPADGIGNVTSSAIRQVCVRAECQTPSAGDRDDRLSDAPSRSTEVMTM